MPFAQLDPANHPQHLYNSGIAVLHRHLRLLLYDQHDRPGCQATEEVLQTLFIRRQPTAR